MTPATRFKFLIVNYIEQYAPLAGEDLLAFAIAYASITNDPAEYTLRTNVNMLRVAAREAEIGHLFDTHHTPAFCSADRLFSQAVSEVAENLGHTLP